MEKPEYSIPPALSEETSCAARDGNQEGILHMLENNMDNAEYPKELVIYGASESVPATGKATTQS